MNPILIQGAMDIEIDHLIEYFHAIKDQEIGGFTFYKSFFKGRTIIISKTNVGIANAGAATAIGILTYAPSLIINQGTAGAHSRDLHTLDIVLGKSCVNINSFEKSPLKTGIDYAKWVNTNFCEYDDTAKELLPNNDLLDVFEKSVYKNGQKHIGVLGSGDVWNKEIEFIDWLHENLQTLCEDMESAGVYKIANSFNVPVIGVRVISNNELLGEPYDRNSAIYLQNYIIKTIELQNS